MDHHLIPLLTRPAQSLCVTGGTQPYAALLDEFQAEQTCGPHLIDPVFLDAPCFTGAGAGLRHNDCALSAIAILDARL